MHAKMFVLLGGIAFLVGPSVGWTQWGPGSGPPGGGMPGRGMALDAPEGVDLGAEGQDLQVEDLPVKGQECREARLRIPTPRPIKNFAA